MDDRHPLDYYPDEETGDDQTDSLMLIDKARAALAQAETLADIGAVREIAERARRYASAARLGRAAENHAARLRLEAERKVGALLAEAPKHSGGRPSETGARNAPVSDAPPKLPEMGITKRQSSDWQRMARVPEPVFEAHVEQAQRKGEALTTAGVLQVARRIERDRAAAEPKPVIAPGTVPARIEVADALALPLDHESVHLVVTSPPYALDVQYTDGDVHPAVWEAFIQRFCMEALRVAVPGGRLAMNVPLDTTSGGYRPTYAQAVACAQRAGWTYRTSIVWRDNTITKTTARGSVDSPSAPHIIARVEMIALFSKGAWGLGRSDASDMSRAEWIEWTDGVWQFPGESNAWEGHPAAFPIRLPRQLIKLLSFPGDVVLDPFVGSGTTALAALQLGRQAIGFDRSQQYVDSTLRRLAAYGERLGAVGTPSPGPGVRESRAPEVLAGGLCRGVDRGAGFGEGVEHVQAGSIGVAR